MRHWIYHPQKPAKIVSDEDYQFHLDQGWFDSPDFQHKDENVLCETNSGLVSADIEEKPRKRGRPSSNANQVSGV